MAAPIQNTSIEEQLFLYKKYMTKLTTEREGLTEARKKQKQENIYQMSKKIYSVVGDEAFAKTIDTYFKQIASVKPGRKLIKALEKTQCVIKIIPGERFECGPDIDRKMDDEEMDRKRTISVKDCEWRVHNTIGKNGERLPMQSPAWIVFAHELIHGLHFFWNSVSYSSYTRKRKGILLRMKNLEEQRTITAWNPFLFVESDVKWAVKKSGFLDSIASFFSSKSKTLKTEDFLCENAFYMALGLPARIDHQEYDTVRVFSEKPDSYDTYYAWLENQIKNGDKIPEAKKNDSDFIAAFLINYPEAAQSIYLEHKHDQEFLLDVYKKMKMMDENASLKFMPDLAKDAEFVLKAMDVDITAFGEADRELRKSKEFVSKILNTKSLSASERTYVEWCASDSGYSVYVI